MKKRYRYPGRSAGSGFTAFIIVIILAVAVGYAGTKYIIYPYLLGSSPASDSQVQGGDSTTTDSGIDTVTNPPSVIIDQQNVQNQQPGTDEKTNADANANSGNSGTDSQTNTGSKGPYSVQFGSFSTKTGADAFSTELAGDGIYSYVYESNGSFKVLGLPYANEDKAKEAASVVSSVVADVFVVDLSGLIQ